MWGVWGIGVPESSAMWKGLRGLALGRRKFRVFCRREVGLWGVFGMGIVRR